MACANCSSCEIHNGAHVMTPSFAINDLLDGFYLKATWSAGSGYCELVSWGSGFYKSTWWSSTCVEPVESCLMGSHGQGVRGLCNGELCTTGYGRQWTWRDRDPYAPLSDEPFDCRLAGHAGTPCPPATSACGDPTAITMTISEPT